MLTMKLVKAGDVVKLSSSGTKCRPGEMRVTRCDEAAGFIYGHVNDIVGAARLDCIHIMESSSDDVEAVESYLISCVRRRDWHGVSDAANDLRVLEALQGKS
jgi:hypothetical protein